MLKMIFLLVGLAVGFGGGVYWGVHHPVEAQKLAAEEERRVMEAKVAATRALKEKLDQIINRPTATAGEAPAGTSGVVSGTRRTAAAAPDPKVVALRDQTERELAEMEKQLAAMPKE